MAEYNPSKIIKDGNTYNFRDTTKIPLAGSNAISGDLIPSTDGTVNLGGPSYQWNNAYIKSLTINGVACGDILTHNASEFVNVTGAQTIGGVKTFTSTIGIEKGSGDVELSIKNTSLSLKANTNSGMDDIRFTDKDNLIVGGLRQSFNNSKVIGMTYSRSYSSDGNSYTQTEFTLVTDNQNGISDAYVKCDNFYPNANATINLGTSTNKWKSFNGINPGALSLPSTYVNVDTTNWVLDGSQPNHFVPTSDGWFGIQCTDTVYDQTHYVFVGRTGGDSAYYQQNVMSSVSALWDSKYHGCVFIPVIKNINYDIRCICSNITATFYPCQGNV